MLQFIDNRDYLFKEMGDDLQWFFERKNRLILRKYKNSIKSRYVPSGEYFGSDRFITPNNNSLYVFAYKLDISCVKTIDYLFLFNYKDGTMISPMFVGETTNVAGAQIYSRHCTDRVEERYGVSFMDAFAKSYETDIGHIKDTCNKTVHDSFMRYFCYGVMFSKIGKLGVLVATTYVDMDKLGSEQKLALKAAKFKADCIRAKHDMEREMEIGAYSRRERRAIERRKFA
jgi:hypothetical protein